MDPLKYFDVEQNTDEWFSMRAGRITSSKLGVVMANYGKAFGEPAKKYAVDIAVEMITGVPVGGGYQNEHMQRGHEQEPIARQEYELMTFCDVSNGGFFCNDTIGCSPDGLVNSGGVIEIKSVIPSVFYANLKRQTIDPAYKWQCYGNLLFTGREWLDFICYCADFPEDKRLYVCRILAENCQSEFKMIESRVSDFIDLVNETKSNIENNNYFIQ